MAKTKDVKLEAMRKSIEAQNKLFGAGTMFPGDGRALDIEGLSTGSLSLDNAIGVGGVPRGRIVEVYGREASGKTMISLSTIAEVQKNGGIAAFIDAEQALSSEWAQNLGVDLSRVAITQPETGNQALRILRNLIQEGIYDVIVLDSVAALVTEKEVKGEIDDTHMAMKARLMSQALPILAPMISKTKTCVIFINQLRDNVGVMYGEKEITPGGKALKFYSSVRLQVWKTAQGAIKVKDEQVGHNVSIAVKKNKVAPPFKTAKFDLYYNTGIDKISEISNLAIEKEIVERPNNRTYVYGENKWTSRGEFDDAIKADEKLANELMNKISEAMKNTPKQAIEGKTVVVAGAVVDNDTGEILEDLSDPGEEI